MFSTQFQALMGVIMEVVPASRGNTKEYLAQQFNEEHLKNMLEKLKKGEFLTEKYEFEGKVAKVEEEIIVGGPYAQFPERLLFLYYVLEHEQGSDAIKNELYELIKSFEQSKNAWIPLKCIADLILAKFVTLEPLLYAFTERLDASLMLLSAVRELYDGLTILQQTFDRYLFLKPLLTTQNRNMIKQAQEHAVLLSQKITSPVSPEPVPVVPDVAQHNNAPSAGWLWQSLTAIATYATQFESGLFTVVNVVTGSFDDSPLHPETPISKPRTPPPSAEAAVLDPVPATASTNPLETASSQIPGTQSVENNSTLAELLSKLHELEKNYVKSDPMTLSGKINARREACELIASSITLISKAASHESRKEILQGWLDGVRESLEAYSKPDLSETHLSQVDNAMRTLASEKLTQLQMSYRSHDKSGFRAIFEELVMLIKTMAVFNCSTLAKAQRVSVCIQSSLFGGAVPPSGRPSRTASLRELAAHFR